MRNDFQTACLLCGGMPVHHLVLKGGTIADEIVRAVFDYME